MMTNRRILKFLFLICLFFMVSAAFSQGQKIPPKYEFRGVWVATVANIDWPSKPGLSTEEQKQELIKLLDEHQKSGINSLMLQIRPATDAIYGQGCGCEFWSRYLTGKQGLPPNPYYDPLSFAIEQAHQRGMELHGWFNPYRATMDLIEEHIHPDHITNKRPDWFFTYSGKKLFNPGLPEVRDYIVKVIMDVVRNYDIDGVHFDDYFYPYPEKGQQIDDTETFIIYGKGFDRIDDWRRNNVDVLIKTLADSIHAAKKYVKFGISPFGIWKNKVQDPEGSETSGLAAYSTLYADSRKWIKEGWIDYINPQIYFPFYYKAAPFEKLTDWWAQNAFGRHVYIGQGAYRVVEKRNGWQYKSQIPNQIRYLRENHNIQGSVYFSSMSLRKNLSGLRDSLQQNFYRYPALPPPMPWLDPVSPAAPKQLSLTTNPDNQVLLQWQKSEKASDGEMPYGYVVYRFEEAEEININSAKNILKISFDANTTYFNDTYTQPDKKYTYVVTAIDRLKNESLPSNAVNIQLKPVRKYGQR